MTEGGGKTAGAGRPPALTILGPAEAAGPDEEEGAEADRPAVVVTGACGNIGRKLCAAWAGLYDLIRVDRAPGPDDADVVAADLADWDDHWPALFEGADVVVHLAANGDPDATWEEVVRPNLDATAHVLHAAALAGVQRVVFASSNHAMGGYRDRGDGPIGEDLPPLPDGPYGASKLVGERLGRAAAAAFELEFIAVRIGWVQTGENRRGTLPDAWSRGYWLSDGDLVRLFTRAVEAELPDADFLVVNGTSANRGTRWSRDRARSALGFEAEDDAWGED